MTRAFTFVFTDIEGSTKRWEAYRVAMRDAVGRHDALMRASIERYDGHIFKTIGDAFCAAFLRPSDALASVLQMQRALAAEDFTEVDGLRVRAALHTGVAEERDNDYFGQPLNKVARLLALGHGGQVLLTGETAELSADLLPQGASLRELGAYHLKDFAEAQQVFQLCAPGLQDDFPPLRSLGTLPSNLSIVDMQEFRPTIGFSGREEELAAVHTALGNDGAVAVVYGLGGVGKSSFAREYGRRNHDFYSVAWWTNAQSEDDIIDGFLRLGAIFVHGIDQIKDRRAAAQRVLHSVLGGFDKPVFIVFDNLEDESLLRAWLPRSARALATSRDASWSSDVTVVPLQTWPVDTAVEFLHRAAARDDLTDADARMIVESLSALPLALAHAAAALRSLRMVTPGRYLERVNEHLKRAPRGTEYPRSVFATFNTAIVQAEQHSAGAAALLCFAAWFAPGSIPDELFRQTPDRYGSGLEPVLTEGTARDLSAAVADEFDLDDALGTLDRFSLLSFSKETRAYTMHRLVQVAARELGAASGVAWPECAVTVADAVFPQDGGVDAWPQCERLMPHARAALGALPENAMFLPAANLANRCSDYLLRRGEFVEAEQLAKRGLTIRETLLGPGHIDVARSLNTLGMTYWSEGRFAEAEVANTRGLEIRERVLPAGDAEVAIGLNSLAMVYLDQGRLDEAERLHRRAIAIWESSLDADHTQVALSLNNLAVLYFAKKQYAEAEELWSRALALREKAFGPEHPEVALLVNNIAAVYVSQERYTEAEPLYLRALAIREKTLGPQHPHVAYTLNNLAELYREQGRYEQAEQLYLQALQVRERALAPDHPDVAYSLHILAEFYGSQGRASDAKPLYTRALLIRSKAYGNGHPVTLETRQALEALAAPER